MTDPPVIVSACLVGLKTRYDGTDARSEAALDALKGRAFIPVCPEQLGGLPTPRPCAWIERDGGFEVIALKSIVRNATGTDVTGQFIAGAEAVLEITRMGNATEAFLKEKSPSCGVKFIKKGAETVEGSGVTAALLKKAGITIKGF